MERTLCPEILDSLPPDHPAALHNRRDLRRLNALLGNYRWFNRTLCRLVGPGERIIELGAGTGELGRRLATDGLAVDGLDLWPRPAGWPAGSAWHQHDLRGFRGFDRYRVAIGNLIFHQFSSSDLRQLGEQLVGLRVIAAAEPARRRVSQLLYRAFAPLLGANHVSLHDGHVSIAAGFCGRELPRLLGLDPPVWDVHCHTTVLGIYRMIAVRLP